MDINNNYYISGKLCGACQELKGRVCLMAIMVDDGESSWNDIDLKHFNDVLALTGSYLIKQSLRYSVFLTLDFQQCFACSDAIISFDSPRDEIDAIVQSIWQVSLNEVQARLKREEDYDEVALLFILNKKGRSSAVMAHSKEDNSGEFVRLFFHNWHNDIQKSYALVHETLHLFGASDFYIIDSVKEKCRKYLGQSIMNEAFTVDDLVVDSLTAYNIGWSNTLDDNASQFLKETQYVTQDYYRRAVKKNTYTGVSIKKYENGDLYYGELKDGIISGQGLMKYHNGIIYNGQWVHNDYQGKGICIYHNGDVYDGSWQKNTREGQGIYYFSNGDVYIGHWHNKREGKGLYLYGNGSYLYGQWIRGKMNGFGIYKTIDGMLYFGQWKDSRREGQGICFFDDGDIYDGQWSNNEKNGEGTLIHKDGTSKTYYYENNQIRKTLVNKENDKKLRIYDSGTICYGQFKKGLVDGQAIILFSGGSLYCGHWLRNEFNGQGISIDKEGNVFDGEFKDHRRIKGIELRIDGKINEM